MKESRELSVCDMPANILSFDKILNDRDLFYKVAKFAKLLFTKLQNI